MIRAGLSLTLVLWKGYSVWFGWLNGWTVVGEISVRDVLEWDDVFAS
jgi:hypothetical protein